MAKQITITVRNYVYDKYLSEYKGNKSAFIEEMLVRGIEAETSEKKDISSKYLQVLRENRELIEENNELKRQIGKYKSIHGGLGAEEAEQNAKLDQYLRSLKLNNPNRHLTP
jgi:hypothetical protein